MQDILGFDLTSLDWRAWLESARDFVLPRVGQTAGQLLLVLVVLWLGRLLLRYVERQVTSRTQTKLDDVLLMMVSRVLMISVSFWGAWRLASIWDLPSFGNFIVTVWIIALAIPVSRFLADLLKVFEQKVAAETATKIDDTALPWISRTIQILVIGAAVMTGLRHLGVDITPILAGASVAGLAFSLAARDTLANLIAGILLVIDRPFEVGDRIQLWGTPARQSSWGDVIEIGIRATKIRTTDNIIVIIPNSEIMNRDIINWTASGDTVRLRIPIGIGYDVDVEQAKRIMLEIASTSDGVKPQPPPVCILRNFGASSVDLELRVWLEDARQRRAVDDALTEKIKYAFDASGIEIPYPKRDLYIRSLESGIDPSGGPVRPPRRPRSE